MRTHPTDIGAIAGFVAAGGLAGVGAFFAVVDPSHAPIYIAGGVALASAAGLARVIFNPTQPSGTQPVIASNEAPTPLRVKDLTTPEQVAQSKETTP